METTFTAKKFKAFMLSSQKNFLDDCKKTNKRTNNTVDDINLATMYFPLDLKSYGYYHYNHHTKCYRWTKNKTQ